MPKRSKEPRIYHNLLSATEEFMRGRNFIPLTQTELAKKLHIVPEHKETFKKVLTALVKKGAAQFSKGRYLPMTPKVDVVSGTIKVHPRGFGFVQADDATLYPKDIFIPRHLTQNAVDGDIVEVQVNPFSTSDKGPEGKVVTILKRGRTHLAGIVRAIELHGDTVAYAPLLGMEQRIVLQPTEQFPLHVGDRIVMEVVDWGSKETETTCRVSHYLGNISDPTCDVPAAIEEYDLRSDFPTTVIREAQKFGTQVSAKELGNREDLRDLECVTIDPDTAKDFDDALNLTKDAKGIYHLGIHIADVSHYVQPGTALDLEAQERSNSTYFPGFCLPMLPGVLSENLCSLRPNVNRLAVSVLIRYNENGDLLDYRICRSVIKSKKRFTYREAKAVLDGEKKSPHKPTLDLLVELCHLLKKKRFERGSIEFSLPELVVIVDESGVPIRTERIQYDITHQLVEECMLQANETVATHLSKHGKGLPYRIHEEPSKENLADFSALVQAFGFNLPEAPTTKDLQQLFDEALNTPYGPFLAISYIRKMRLALYSPANIGHYGLGLSHYCHFTSPIRRYIDLEIHRILFGKEGEQDHLEGIARHCSERERISERAENHVVLLKKLRLLKKLTHDDPYRQFEAVVARVRNFGVYFEVFDLMLEGFLHVSELDDDFYEFNDRKGVLKGAYSGTTFFAGDKITVMLKDLDLILLEAKWSLVGDGRKKRRKRKGRGKK